MLERIIKFLRRKESTEYYWKLRTRARHSKSPIRRYYNRYLHKKLMVRNNASIPYTVSIEDMPTFPHGISGVFISLSATIGKGCTIFHQVTIGSNTLDSSKNCGAPKIGDNVYIGCGAKIIGGITIGNNVRIGANCVVVEDVPDNSTVVMNKPRVIPCTSQRNNTFIPIGNYNADKKSGL